MTPTEAKVSAICARVLNLAAIEAEDDLYDLGSDSHHAVLIALEIERSFHIKLPLELMETAPRVSSLAAWIDRQPVSSASADNLRAIPDGGA